MHRLLLLLLMLSLSSSPMAATQFTLLSPENEQDARMDYYREAMRLALEKTRQQYGDYELHDSLKMNKARMRLEEQKPGRNALFIIDNWPQKTPHHEVGRIPFPIDLGILGYRVCFVGADRAKVSMSSRTEWRQTSADPNNTASRPPRVETTASYLANLVGTLSK